MTKRWMIRIIFFVLCGGAFLARSTIFPWIAPSIQRLFFNFFSPLFSFDTITIYGKKHLQNAEIAWALGLKEGDCVWHQSLEAIHQRLLQLPWVRHALVRRQLPSKIFIYVIEREPMATWQHKEHACVVDTFGDTIPELLEKDFPQLPVLTGSNAPYHFIFLQKTLEKEGIFWRIRGASLLPSHRWDIYISDEKVPDKIQTIRLPKENLERRLRQLKKIFPLLCSYKTIDARMEGALLLEEGPLLSVAPDTGFAAKDKKCVQPSEAGKKMANIPWTQRLLPFKEKKSLWGFCS